MNKSGYMLWTRALTLVLLLLLCAGAAEANTTAGGLTFEPSEGISRDGNAYYIDEAGEYIVKMEKGVTSTENSISVRTDGVTLNLNGVTIQNNSAAISSKYGLNVGLFGKNTISGIMAKQSGLRIFGDGILTLADGSGISANSVFIESGTITLNMQKDSPIYTSSAVISGGSVNASFSSEYPLRPVNAAEPAVPVYLTKIRLYNGKNHVDAGKVVGKVGSTDDGGYKFEGSQTDSDGTLYFYLPVGATVSSISLSDGIYIGDAITTNNDEEDVFNFTKYTPPLYPFSVRQTSATGGYTNAATGLTISAAGEYTVSMGDYTKSPYGIIVDAPGDVKLTLNALNVETNSSPALHIKKGSHNVTLHLPANTVSTFRSAANYAGIQKDSANEYALTISADDTTGELNATGGDRGAGIGGGRDAEGNNIKITGGTVTATGGVYAAGIGGGEKGGGRNITITGGTVIATGSNGGVGIGGGLNSDEKYITITGGSVFGTVSGAENVPVEITLKGAGAGIKVTAASIKDMHSEYKHGLNDVVTVEGGKLRFFLPVNTMLADITAGGKKYTDTEDYTVSKDGGSVTLNPPQYRVSNFASIINNDYRNGLILAPITDGNTLIKLDDTIKITDAPIEIRQPATPGDHKITFSGLKIDASKRGKPSIVFGLPTIEEGAPTITLDGVNLLKGVRLVNNPTYDLRVKIDKDAAVKATDLAITKIEIPVTKADTPLARLLPDFTLEGGSGAGAGSFRAVKTSEDDHQLTAENCHISYEGVVPVKGTLTLDKDSTLTVGENSTLIILPGSKVTGEGRLEVKGSVVGTSDVPVYYQVNATAQGGKPVLLTGVANGYAASGALVSAEATDTQGFIGWTITPYIEGIDLTKPKIEFTVKAPCALTALYETKVTGVKFDKDKVEIEVGDSRQLKWSVLPDEATDKMVTFACDNIDVATVDENGIVSAVSAGEATVTVTTVEGGFTAACAISVTDGAIRPLDVEKAAIALKSKLKLNPPAGYAGTWSVKDAAIAEIVKENAVKGVGLGETELTFTVTQVVSKSPSLVRGKTLSVGESASVPLAVRKKKEIVKKIEFSAKTLYLAPGEETEMSVTLKPAAAPDKNMLYKTADSRVARVEGSKIIALSLGKTRLTAVASSLARKNISVVVTDVLQKLVPTVKKVKLAQGQYVQLEVKPLPASLPARIVWTSNKESVARVSETGIVTGVSAGKAKITAACGKKKAVVTVTVSP